MPPTDHAAANEDGPTRRPRRRPLLLLATAALVAAALAAGCGSDEADTDPTVAWADGVCTSLVTWKDSITSIGESLTGEGLSQSAFTDAVDEATGATETLLDDLRGLGRPETDAGDEAEQAIETFADDVEESVRQIEEAVEGAEGVGGAVAAASTVSAALASMGTQISSTIDTLKGLDADGELRDAFEQADACDPLTS